MRNTKWVGLLAYVTGSDQELLVQNEYLASENRILRAKLPWGLPRTFVEKLATVDSSADSGR